MILQLVELPTLRAGARGLQVPTASLVVLSRVGKEASSTQIPQENEQSADADLSKPKNPGRTDGGGSDESIANDDDATRTEVVVEGPTSRTETHLQRFMDDLQSPAKSRSRLMDAEGRALARVQSAFPRDPWSAGEAETVLAELRQPVREAQELVEAVQLEMGSLARGMLARGLFKETEGYRRETKRGDEPTCVLAIRGSREGVMCNFEFQRRDSPTVFAALEASNAAKARVEQAIDEIIRRTRVARAVK